MAKVSSRNNSKKTTVDKGRIVEQIVAWMHKEENVKVETNVRLPARGKIRRYREIDILITSVVSGYPVRIAIECKNEQETIGSPKIDAFIGKLIDVGIPLQHGIFVSSSSYTSGAIARAEEAGIRPLILSGLNKDKLSSEVLKAFQSIIYLLLSVQNYQALFERDVLFTPPEQPNFYNRDGEMAGFIPDLIWKKWLKGEIADSIGEHSIKLELPPEWQCIVKGRVEKVISIEATVRVQGLVTTFSGDAESYFLTNAANKQPEKHGLKASFSKPSGRLPVQNFDSEQDLEDFLNQGGPVSVVVGRIRLPRILIGAIRWPVSERVANIMARLERAYRDGIIPPIQPENIANLEGSYMEGFWEPIWSKHPAIKNKVREAVKAECSRLW